MAGEILPLSLQKGQGGLLYSTKDLRKVLMVQAICNTLGVETIVLKVFSHREK